MQKGVDYIAVGACMICHDGKGKFVLLKRGAGARDEHGRWDIVGGGIEFGDTPENTIKKEELDTEVLDYEFLGYLDVHREQNGKQTHWIQLAYKVLIDRKRARIAEPHKFDDMGWFTFTNLPTPLHSQWPNFLKKFKDKLNF